MSSYNTRKVLEYRFDGNGGEGSKTFN